MERLHALGWNDQFQHEFDTLSDDSLQPARVASASRNRFYLIGLPEPQWATPSGRLLREDGLQHAPSVGDWVATRLADSTAVVEAVLPRRSCLMRKKAGRDALPQIIAANLDRVFIVTAAGRDFNPRRIERYLTAVWDGGAQPIVVVNKMDLADPTNGASAMLGSLPPGVTATFISAKDDEDLGALMPYIRPRETIAFVGSSGVGKSTTINRLLGTELQATRSIRGGDEKGRHATRRRELLVTPAGAILVDTPGMREMGLWDAERGLSLAFEDVEQRAASCRFRDCTHAGEPGCAVASAVTEGELPSDRVDSYQRLRREISHLEQRASEGPGWDTKKRWKTINKGTRQGRKQKRRIGLDD